MNEQNWQNEVAPTVRLQAWLPAIMSEWWKQDLSNAVFGLTDHPGHHTRTTPGLSLILPHLLSSPESPSASTLKFAQSVQISPHPPRLLDLSQLHTPHLSVVISTSDLGFSTFSPTPSTTLPGNKAEIVRHVGLTGYLEALACWLVMLTLHSG
jgi:hypothetical protein